MEVDFISRLPEGATIISAQSYATVHSGTDLSASAIISGAPALLGTKILQPVVNVQPGVIYQLTFAVTGSDFLPYYLYGYLASVVP